MSTRDLICCPSCDAVYTVRETLPGSRATCARCHTVLITPRRKAGKQIISVGLGMAILAVAACIFPFLHIGVAGVSNDVTILGAAFSFTRVHLTILALAVTALIIVVPVTRVALLIYVLWPVVHDRPPARHAVPAFRFAEELRPWAMAEVFIMGCVVALVKMQELARVEIGPAFWMFAALAVLMVVQDNFMCRWSVWRSLERNLQK